MPASARLSRLAAMVRRDWKNPPNLVTAARMVGTLGLPPLVLSENKQRRLAGLLLFGALAGSDKLDGWMAKRIYGSTDLGKLLDPLADKELIGVTLFTILADAKRHKNHGLASTVMVAIVILSVRELFVARIKLRAQEQFHQVDSAIQSGRVSMALESVAVGALLIPRDTPNARRIKSGLLTLAVGASLYSWREYHQKYRTDLS